MKGIILYQSKYGATRRYAGWLAEETGFACVETAKTKIDDLLHYDTILLGGGVYASGIAGLSFLRKHIRQLRNKHIQVFCVGASPYEESAFQQLYSRNMKGPLAGLPLFYCRGSWDMEHLNYRDRILCRLLQKAVAKKEPSCREGWEKALAETGDLKCDWTSKSYIAPILKVIR